MPCVEKNHRPWGKKVGNWKPPEEKNNENHRPAVCVRYNLRQWKKNVGNRKPPVHEVGLEDAPQN